MRTHNLYPVAALAVMLLAAPAAFAESPESSPGAATSSPGSAAPGGPGSAEGSASPGMSGQEGPASTAADLDEQTINKVADAIASVQLIHEDYSQQLQDAQGDAEAQILQSEAQQKMVDAVQQSGLSVEEYNEVIARMNQDPQLRDQILQKAETVSPGDTQG